MSGLDMIGFTIAVVAALECITGRLAQLDRARHRPIVIGGYTAAACICILSASCTWQGLGIGMLDLLSLGIAGHLVLTWGDWWDHPPSSTERGPEFPAGAVPSRIDGGDSRG